MDKWPVTVLCPHCRRSLKVMLYQINPGQSITCTFCQKRHEHCNANHFYQLQQYRNDAYAATG